MDVINKKEIKHSKKTIKFCIGIACFLILLIFIAQPIIVYFITNNHVNYKGYVTADYPLQDIFTASDFDLETNEQTLLTQDGYKIWSSEVSIDHPKAVILYLSGIQQPSVTYFYGHAKWMKKNGFASILIEVRGHGKSDGNRVCLGYEEVADVKAVVDYIKKQDKYKNVPIVLQGVSMGGAIAINAFGQIKEIDGLIAMSAYSSFEDVVYDTICSKGVPAFIAAIERPMIHLGLRVVFGDKVNVFSPIRQVENIGERPALFIASADDKEVPPVNMKRILEKAPAHCESWLRDSWAHFIVNDCDFVNMEQDTEYCARILTFLETKVVKQ